MRRVVPVLLLAACGPPPQDRPDSGPPIYDADTSCGAQTEVIEVEEIGDPPDLLIVLDRSGSMTAEVPPDLPIFPSSDRWTVMRNALNNLANNYEDNIRFGLLEFPTDFNCAVNGGTAVRVPVDIHQAAEISGYFTSRTPGGNTPASNALQAALTHYQGLPVNPVGRYVLFATDGEPNCVSGAAGATVAAVTALAEAGINTFVLGFGDGIDDDTVLRDSAIAGLVPRPNAPYYYAADSAGSLASAFADIAGGIAPPSCTYALDSVPPVPEDVTVTLGGEVVPRSLSHTNGWDYYPDAMTITFFGEYCQDITNLVVSEVSFVYGCPGPVVP